MMETSTNQELKDYCLGSALEYRFQVVEDPICLVFLSVYSVFTFFHLITVSPIATFISVIT